jgi:hypothetical protein
MHVHGQRIIINVQKCIFSDYWYGSRWWSQPGKLTCKKFSKTNIEDKVCVLEHGSSRSPPFCKNGAREV